MHAKRQNNGPDDGDLGCFNALILYGFTKKGSNRNYKK